MTPPLPAKTDILVIGGGIAGCAIAYYLAQAGAGVVLLERHSLNTLASGSNAGSVHAQIPQHEFLKLGEDWARGFAPAIPLLMDSIALWRDLPAELDADLELSLDGGLMVARTEAQMQSVARKVAIEQAHGLPVELLSAADLRRIAPYIAGDMVGGSFCSIEGRANPLLVTPNFARRAAELGAIVRTNTALQGLSRDGDGFAAATSAGPISARRVVNCAGADAARVAAMLGLDLPLEGFAIQVNVTVAAQPLVPHLVYFAAGQLTLKQAHNGGFLIGGGWPAARDPATGRPVVDPRSAQANLRLAASVVPGLAAVPLLRTWPAVVNGTPDWRPILGEAPGIAGFYLCCFPWIGFSAGPIAARSVADQVLGRPPSTNFARLMQ